MNESAVLTVPTESPAAVSGRAKKTIMVVDDDTALLELVGDNLRASGYEVLPVIDAESAQWILKGEIPDLVILDVMLPRMDGFELARRIREFSAVPIIMLTVKMDEGDVVKGLRLGANDYVTKPFRIQELLARVEAALRPRDLGPSATSPGLGVLNFGDLVIDTARRRVAVRGNEVLLTPTEYKLLVQFARNPGKVLSHSELLTDVWGPEYKDEAAYLRVFVGNLRKKLEEDPSHPRLLLSRTGIGYVFDVIQKAGAT